MATGLVGVALLAGCGNGAGPASGRGSGPGSGSSPSVDPGRTSRATQLLDQFAAAQASGDPGALAVAPAELVRQDGDWEEAVGSNNKQASLSGHLVAVAPLPTSPEEGVVIDGTGRRVPTSLMSATVTLAELTRVRTDCNGCTELEVTSARLTTMEVNTSSGTATVPAWRFALKGTAVGLLRVAVPASGLVEPPPAEQPQPGDGMRADSFTLVDSSTLRLRFVGSPDQSGPCGADYRAEQYASDTAVVIAVLELPRRTESADVACTAVGALRTADVELAAPLGDRPVLNLAGADLVPQG